MRALLVTYYPVIFGGLLAVGFLVWVVITVVRNSRRDQDGR